MEKDSIFFGEQGLTSSSARSVSNIANEKKRAIRSHIDNVSFISSTVSMPMSPSGKDMKTAQGYSLEDIRNIPDMLDTVGDLDSLMAWLNEAIRDRGLLMQECTETTFEQWLKKRGVTLEEPRFTTELERPSWDWREVQPERPVYRSGGGRYPDSSAQVLCDNDVIATLTVKERNRLFSLASRVALYGKYIGKSEKDGDGALLKARKEYLDKIGHEYEVEGKGGDTVITHHTGSVETAHVESLYFELQRRWREAQKEYNGMMKMIEEKGQDMYADMLSQYQKDLSDWEQRRAEARKRYDAEMIEYQKRYEAEVSAFNERHDEFISRRTQLRDEYQQWMQDEKKRIQELKIIIPDGLRKTYESLKA